MFDFHLPTQALDNFIRGLPVSTVGLIWSYPTTMNLYEAEEWPILNQNFDRVLDLSTLAFNKVLNFSELHFLQTQRFGQPFFLLLIPINADENLNLGKLKQFIKSELSLLQQLSLQKKELALLTSFSEKQGEVLMKAIHETFIDINILRYTS